MREYISFIHKQTCLVTGTNVGLDAHHVRCLYKAGTGKKPPDSYCVPLCHNEHMKLHQYGERSYWEKHGIDIEREITYLNLKYLLEDTSSTALNDTLPLFSELITKIAENKWSYKNE